MIAALGIAISFWVFAWSTIGIIAALKPSRQMLGRAMALDHQRKGATSEANQRPCRAGLFAQAGQSRLEGGARPTTFS